MIKYTSSKEEGLRFRGFRSITDQTGVPALGVASYKCTYHHSPDGDFRSL
jgi:hypothetical protein